MKKYDYYLHKNRCRLDNEFGRIGKPMKVSWLRYILWEMMGFRATKVPRGTSETEVLVTAALNQGAHPDSYKIQRIRETGRDN